MSMAAALAGHCASGRIASRAPSAAAPASTRRRLERLLGNPRLDDEVVTADLVRAFAAAWPAGRRWVLIIDETDRDDHIRSLQVLVAYKRRAIPLAVRAYRPAGGRRGRRPKLLFRLLRLIAANLPAGTHVTVLADRGLAWPKLIELCEALGWHYVIRVQGQTAVRVWPDRQIPAAVRSAKAGADGDVYARADELAPRRPGGPALAWPAKVFRMAGWIDCQFTAAWKRGAKGGVWLVVSDERGGWARCRKYATRCWCEETFRDEKSGGFRWRESRVDEPARATRLLIVIALAMLLCLALGARLVRRGLRRLIDPHATRLLSYFQLGLRWLARQTVCDQTTHVPVNALPP
jgi:hypothetical protein